MRSFLLLLSISTLTSITAAQEAGPDLTELPGWIHAALTGDPEPKTAKSSTRPMHTNAFIGTWTLRDMYGRRIHYWGDQHRMVFREMRDTVTTTRITVVDLQANVKVKMSPSKEMSHITLEDLKLEQAGYFYELFNDTVIATGRTENVMGQTCEVLLGANSNKDTTTYYRTTVHSKLFADLKVWAVWLCREGNLEYLSAFSDRNAGSSLRVTWKDQGYSTTAGDWYFEEITPGKQPTPMLPWLPNRVIDERFLFTNNARLGRLPDWMRERINRLPSVKPLVQSTPPAVDRGFPDNRFVGTFTAQTMTRYIDQNKDTTEQYANYSYWANERRAVVSVDAPHEKGITLYMVDLDNDVAVAAYNEGHSYVIPRLYIGTLERVGIPELMEGIDIELASTGKYRTILGERCELHLSQERWAGHYWYPDHATSNPVLDMVRWMQPGYIQSRHMEHFEDLLAFAAKGRPMPYAVNGTYLTSFKPGKVPPPAMDLSNYRVLDERFRDLEKEREEYEREKALQQTRIITIEEMNDLAIPVEEGDNMPKAAELMIVETEPEPSGGSGLPRVVTLEPEIEALMNATTNQFIGTAKMHFTSTWGENLTTWTVRYASTADRMVIIGKDEEGGSTVHNWAYVIDRKAGTETTYLPVADSIRTHMRKLDTRFGASFQPAMRDSVITGIRKLLGRDAQHRLMEEPVHRRESWVDENTPSLFHDVLGARKGWGGVETLLRGPMITSTLPGMPLEVTYNYKTDETMIMRVMELKPGAVDPKVFTITKKSWK